MGKSTKNITLKNLDCAGCAAKIENEINRLEDVQSAVMNFPVQMLTVEININKEWNQIKESIIKIVKEIEPGVEAAEITGKKVVVDTQSQDVKFKIIKIAIGILLFILAYVFKSSKHLQIALYVGAYVVAGYDVLKAAFKNIKAGQVFGEHFLMSIATLGAIGIREYPEAVAVMLFYKVGELFQSIAVNRSRKSIKDLMDIRPDYANLKEGENISRVSPESIRKGDLILIKPGEKVPLDGQVIEGHSTVDTSALTGESVQRTIRKNEQILSGFINISGVLTVKVTKIFEESTANKILHLVENASSKKAPTENFITKFARYYTPSVVLGAAALAVIPSLVIKDASFSSWLYRALVFLVISCPCALVISIPMSFFGGIGGASKAGILIKGGNYLEALNYVDTVVFDKTGTLTKGKFRVTSINPQNQLSKVKLLEYAALAEAHSYHPIAKSILKEYGKTVDQNAVNHYTEIPGQGVRAVVNEKEILAGNQKLLQSNNVPYIDVLSIGTIVHVAVNKEYLGFIEISDEIKEDAGPAIDRLRKLGIKNIIMLTGDNRHTAQKVAQIFNLDKVLSQLLPHQKVEKIEMLESQKEPRSKLAFVGDGINDAPALARADIGIAMGGLGSDAAIEAADIVLMTDHPSRLADAIKIAKRTRKIVMQNIFLAIGIKAIILLMGALGHATMWGAVFADVGVALLAVLNSMRALDIRGII